MYVCITAQILTAPVPKQALSSIGDTKVLWIWAPGDKTNTIKVQAVVTMASIWPYVQLQTCVRWKLSGFCHFTVCFKSEGSRSRLLSYWKLRTGGSIKQSSKRLDWSSGFLSAIERRNERNVDLYVKCAFSWERHHVCNCLSYFHSLLLSTFCSWTPTGWPCTICLPLNILILAHVV